MCGCGESHPRGYFIPIQLKWIGKGNLGHTFLIQNPKDGMLYIRKVLKFEDYRV